MGPRLTVGDEARAPTYVSRRFLLVWTIVVLVVGLVTSATAITSGAAGYALTRAGILSRIHLKSAHRINIDGSHMRLIMRDGNLELEHQRGTALRLNSYYVGTPVRSPINVGVDDGQDVVELRVRGTARRSTDLAQWVLGSRVVAALDAHGNLRLANVTLAVRPGAKGITQLVATFSNGKSAVIASSAP